MTFGYGRSTCPGRQIAMVEIKVVVLALLKYFDVCFEHKHVQVPDFDITHLGVGIMPPLADVNVVIKSL